MAFKDLATTNNGIPKHERIIAAVEAKNASEAEALRSLIFGSEVEFAPGEITYSQSPDRVSELIAEEMPNYTDNEKLHTLSARQIARIRKAV